MGQRRRANPTHANDRAAAQRLKLRCKGFEVGAGNGGAMQAREFFGVADRLDFLTQALWNPLKADFQRFEDVLLLGEDQSFLATFEDTFPMAFLATFLAELFGE
jgi:hypothetical protein